MLRYPRRNESQGDHNYVAQPVVRRSSSDDSSVELETPARRRSRRQQMRGRLLRLGNTDHDYFVIGAVGEEEEETDELRAEEFEVAPDDDLDEGEEAEVASDSETVNTEQEQEQDQEQEQNSQESALVEEGADDADAPAASSPDIEPGPSVNVEVAVAAVAEEDAAAAEEDAAAINLISPSPPKKRKRLSLGTPKSNTPCVRANNGGAGGGDEEDDGLTCPICLDTWEMSGEHRLVSLRCGHLFGDACIRRWLNESARQTGLKVCPQCKTKAANRDIRCLYAKRLRAIDRSEEHQLREQLDEERRRTQTLQTEVSAMKMAHKMVTIQIQTLQSENDRMKQLLRTGGGSGFSYDADLIDSKHLLRLQIQRLYLERTIEITREPGCRVMIQAERHSSMLVSQKSAQGLFPGYGVRFVDTPTFRTTTFLHTSARLLRDICLSADQQLLAVASMETRVKLFDLRTRQVSTMFEPGEKTLWSCAIDSKEREHSLYLGGSNGSTYIYDLRFPESIVEEYKTEGDFSTVINVAAVCTGATFPHGGFLVCKLQSIWFFEYTCSGSEATGTRLNVEGPFSSMNFDAAHETLVVSARSSIRHPQSRYILGRLEKVDGTTVFNIKVSFNGSKATPVMTRCTQMAVEANTLVAGYIQDAKQLALFDVRREQRVQSMPVQEIVYDICPVYLGSNATYLAALTETKCRLYKMTSSDT